MLAHKFTHKGVEVELHQEEDSSYVNPRGDVGGGRNLGIMFCWHPDYELGDEQFGRPSDERQFHTMEDVATYLHVERGALVILPLFLLDHSGLTIRAGEPIIGDANSNQAQERMKASGQFPMDGAGWDTTHVGFIYTNQENVDEMGAPPETLLRQLREEVKEYDLYLQGEVYFYIVGRDTPFEESCGGFIGHEYAIEEAKEMAQYVSESLERESEEEAAWAARDTVTID